MPHDSPARAEVDGAEEILDAIGEIDRDGDEAVEASVADAGAQLEPLVETVREASMEDLLEGDFESVAEVLGDVFEQHAIAVQGSASAVGVLGEPGAAAPPAAEEPPVAAAAPVATEPDAGVPVAMPERSSEPEGEASLEAEEPVEATTAEPADAPAARPVVVSVVIAALAAMNLPLRRLPPPVREAVDWLALSLVLWVPLVWILVLLR